MEGEGNGGDEMDLQGLKPKVSEGGKGRGRITKAYKYDDWDSDCDSGNDIEGGRENVIDLTSPPRKSQAEVIDISSTEKSPFGGRFEDLTMANDKNELGSGNGTKFLSQKGDVHGYHVPTRVKTGNNLGI